MYLLSIGAERDPELAIIQLSVSRGYQKLKSTF